MTQGEILKAILALGGCGESLEETADLLLQRFGSLGAVMDAPPAMLATFGVNESAAVLLRLLPEVARYEAKEGIRPRTAVHDAEDMARLFCQVCHGCRKEELWLMCLDENLRLLSLEQVAGGTVSAIPVVNRDIIGRVLACGAHYVAMAHTHPGGLAEASDMDCVVTRELSRCLDALSVPLLEHFVIAGDTYQPILLFHTPQDFYGQVDPESFYSTELRQKARLHMAPAADGEDTGVSDAGADAVNRRL